MDTLEIGLRLHDRSTQGEKLTAEERAQLDAWYKEQDTLEAEILNQADEDETKQLDTQETIRTLRTQIDTLMADLADRTKQIQTLIEQNNRLREENSSLRQQLVQQAPLNAA